MLCSDACFALWESKHKGSLRGSARVLAALLQQPQLLKPLLQQPDAAGAFRELLAALPARHRSHLATGKGWQVGDVSACCLSTSSNYAATLIHCQVLPTYNCRLTGSLPDYVLRMCMHSSLPASCSA
jgi:hypothetical protein